MGILDKLNDKQIEAVTVGDGPVLVLAGAGTGKTLTLVHRIAYLIGQGVAPDNILAVTFTNKAANEMKDRIKDLLGRDTRGMWYGTFHSICGRLMRQYHRYLPDGYTNQFTIVDERDSLAVIKGLLGDTRSMEPRMIADIISAYKTRLVSPRMLLETATEASDIYIANLYDAYQTHLRLNNSVDFDDMIMLTVNMMRTNKELLTRLQDKFLYVMADEYQDVNYAQYQLVKLLAGKHHNIFAVGDDFQCLEQNDTIQTDCGPKAVKDLTIGDRIQTLFAGQVDYAPMTAKSEPRHAQTITVTTENGYRTTVSCNHKMFASLPPFDGTWYVYLMWRPDRGYRLGITSGGLAGIIGCRTHSEKPKKLWLIAGYDSAADAALTEISLSLQYSVPTSPYFHNGRGLSMTQDHLDKLFDTYGNNGLPLLHDLGLHFDYPNFVPRNTTRQSESVRNVNLYLGNRKGSCQVSFESDGTRIRKQFSGQQAYIEALAYANDVCEQNDAVSVVEKLTIDNGHLSTIPASGLLIGMSVPVIVDGTMQLSKIVSIEQSEGVVYDIEVARTGVVVSDGIVSHNSIYGWRGSDISLILRFAEDYPDARTMRLEQNYRSTKSIIGASNAVIQNNDHQIEKHLWTNNMTGDPVYIHHAFSDLAEAQWTIDTIRALMDNYGYAAGDFAVLYRTNQQSRLIEDVLLRYRMNYVMVGGTSFYERTEIRDLLAYMKFITNPQNSISLQRILNVPKRGIGAVTLDKLNSYAAEHNMSLGETLLYADRIEGLRPSAISSITAFVQLISELDPNGDAYTLINEIIERTGYMGHLEGCDNCAERRANVRELVRVCRSYVDDYPDHASYEFVQEISLLTDVDRLEHGADAVKLLTVHNAKGLEFPVVFIVGVEERVFPHHKSLDSQEEIDEERRLFYVAMTRAKELLYLTHADTRYWYGQQASSSLPSRFIEEIPSELLVAL